MLLVEPERAYLGMLARRLADAGFRVAAADSAQAALAELYRVPADIVLTELTGKRFSGIELLSIIRADAALRDIPVLMFSNRADQPAAVQALREGADEILRKPFHFEVLVARIERELQRRRTIDELRRDNRTLDARIIERAILIGELKDKLARSETARLRLELGAARATP